MIPYTILACTFIGKNSLEVRVLELSKEYFTIRLDHDVDPGKFVSLCMHFYQFEKSTYQDYQTESFSLECINKSPFYRTYKITIEDREFQKYTSQIMKEYGTYISLKLNKEERMVSQEMTGYPADQEEVISDSVSKQISKWLGTVTEKKAAEETSVISLNQNRIGEHIFGISLDRPDLWVHYIEHGCAIMLETYFKKHQLDAWPICQKTKQSLRYLYIGNQFCPLLFPDSQMLIEVLNRSIEDGLIPVIVFSFVRESLLQECEKRMDLLQKWFLENCDSLSEKCKTSYFEIVVNDWGTLRLMKKYADTLPLKITLGTLLTKRRKDTRFKWKKGYTEQSAHELGKNYLDDVEFVEKLRHEFSNLNLQYSYESCGYEIDINREMAVESTSEMTSEMTTEIDSEMASEIAGIKHQATLFFPYYQMNTSSYCTLQAYCQNGDRGHQKEPVECEQFCRDYVFMYPDMLQMIGKYNSLFGMDTACFTEDTWLARKCEQGITRFVWNL